MDEKLKSHFLNLYCMTVADGNVSPKELEQMYKIGVDYYQLTPEEIDKTIISGDIVFYKPETEEERVLYLYDLALIAYANGVVDEEEKLLLKKYAIKFDVALNQIETLIEFLLKNAKEKLSHKELLKQLSK
jgi:uncharacterized tellurite resistance protein B-like protein